MTVKTKEQILEEERLRKAARMEVIEQRKRNATRPKGLSETATGSMPTRLQIKELKNTVDTLKEEIASLENSSERLVRLDPSDIEVTEYANRNKRFVETDSFHELKEDIRKNDVQSPIIVRKKAGFSGKFELVYGRRRLEACSQLSIMVKAQIIEADNKKLAILQEIENLHRQDITPFDRGRYYQLLIDKGHFDSQLSISSEFGLSQAEVSKLLKMNQLPDWIKVDICDEGFAPKTKRLIEELSMLWFTSETKRPGIEENKALLKSQLSSLMQIEGVSDRIKSAKLILEQKAKPEKQKIVKAKKTFEGQKTITFEKHPNGTVKITLNNKMSLTPDQLKELELKMLDWAVTKLGLTEKT